MTAVNPHEGQVAIPYAKADGGVVVGRLGARAMRWVEEATGQTLDEIYADVIRRVEAQASGAATVGGFPVAVVVTLLWAAIEHERRLSGGPGPGFTIDDGDAIVEEIGLDSSYNYAITLIQLSTPFKKRAEALEEAAATAGIANPLDPLRAAASAALGTGTPTSPPPTAPVFPPPPPGN